MPMLLPSEKNKTEQNPLKPKQKTNKKKQPNNLHWVFMSWKHNLFLYFYSFTSKQPSLVAPYPHPDKAS